jgi:hypothetical protein
VQKLKHVLPLEQWLFYRKVSDRKILRKAKADNLYAYAFSNGSINRKNHFHKILTKMKERTPEGVHLKHNHTLDFIDKHA